MKHLIKVAVTVSFLAVAVTGTLLTAQAEVPHLINYQGKLTDNDGKALDGSYSITFRIYDNEGKLLWDETQNVIVDRGVFSVMLGATEDLDIPFDKPYFLEFKVGDEVLSPRQRIASVGYALMAENADSAVTADNAEMIKGMAVDTPAADDDGKLLRYDHSNSKFGLVPSLKMKTGVYTGNGNDTQQITGVGFKPKMVLIGRKSGQYQNPTTMYLKVDSMDPAFSIYMNGNESGHSLSYVDLNNPNMGVITSLDADGFSVWGEKSHAVGANVGGWDYWYVCFGE